MEKITLFLKIILVIFILNFYNLFSQWEQCGGPYGGKVHSLTISGTSIFAGTNDGVFLSTDNGNSWSGTTLKNQTVYCIAINGTNIFTGTNGNGVFLSTDNGNNWTQTTLNNQVVYSITISGNNILAGTEIGVLVTTDNGITWTLTLFNEYYSVNCFAINGTNIFVGTMNGIFLSTDNGYIWEKTAVENMPVLSLATSDTNIFAGTWGDGIIFSKDNGKFWFKYGETSIMDKQSVSCLVKNGSYIFAGTWGKGVLLSTDNGKNWTQTKLNNKIVYSLTISDSYIFAGTDENSVFRAKISDLTNVEEESNTASILNIFPNPIQNKAKISFQLEKPDFVSLQITNILGQVVGDLITNKFMESGEHSFDFDASNLPSGMYFVCLRVGNELINEKMIVNE